jgi:hypothetical protein
MKKITVATVVNKNECGNDKYKSEYGRSVRNK